MSDAISTYLTITKNEPAAIAKFAASDPATKKGVATLTKDAPKIGTPTALLNDQAALAVVLGAFGMSGDASETAVLKDLMTQDPSDPKSLAATANNADFKAFAGFMQNVATVNVALGSAGTMALSASGSAAASVTVQNTAFGAATGASATNVGTQWSFVLNDGTPGATIAAALEAAAGKGTYTVNADGSVSGADGAPVVTAAKDTNGDSVYTLTTATDGTGKPTKQVRIVSVPVAAASGDSASSAATASSRASALVGAMQAMGFQATLAAGTLSISGNDIDVSNASGTTAAAAQTGNIAFSTTATAASSTASTVLALGAKAAGLQAGQVVMDGNNTVGTIQSVDAAGNVTLTAPAKVAVAAGDTLTVSPALTTASTPALQDPAQVQAAISEYQTNQFETAQDQQNPGMHTALYFTRQASSVKSLADLMSDPTLLSVVVTNLGLQENQFGALDYNQQVAILTKDVNIAKFQDPKYIQQASEQYLILNQQNQPTPLPTGVASLFDNEATPSQQIMAILGGTTLTTASVQGNSDPLSSLFA